MKIRTVLLAVILTVTTASALAQSRDVELMARLDKALDIVRGEKGFEVYSKRLDRLRSANRIIIAKLDGNLAMVNDPSAVYVTRKLLGKKSIGFIASTLAHEAVHLGQDDSRYFSVEEIEYRAYQVGGRLKQRIGMTPTTIEKAAMRLPRSAFIREANTIFTTYSGLAQRKKALTFDRESLSISTLEGLRELAALNGVRTRNAMTKAELVDALTDRLNAGGLERMRVRDLRILAGQQGLGGASKMTKSQLVRALRQRLDVHRLGVYSFSQLRTLAAERGIDIKPLRSRRATIEAIRARDDKNRRRARATPKKPRSHTPAAKPRAKRRGR